MNDTARDPGFLDGGPGFQFMADRSWGDLPPGYRLQEVTAVATGPDDRVYVFNRGEHHVAVFEPDGRLIGTWGDDLFKTPHGLRMLDDGTLLCTDDGDGTVRWCTTDGEVLLTIGSPGVSAPWHSGRPFALCTDAVRAADGTFFVTDGYRNARVHHFDHRGDLIGSWGSAGTGPGEFNVPHNIVQDADGRLYVADRESHRIQVFDQQGTFLRLLGDRLHRPAGITLAGGDRPLMYVAEVAPYLASNHGWPGLGPRISVLTLEGELMSRFGSHPAGFEPGQLIAPHGIAVDSRGDVYVAETAKSGWPGLFPGTELPEGVRGLLKLVRIPAHEAAHAG